MLSSQPASNSHAECSNLNFILMQDTTFCVSLGLTDEFDCILIHFVHKAPLYFVYCLNIVAVTCVEGHRID